MKNKNFHIDPEALHDEEIQLQPDADNSDESGIAADDKLAQEDNALKELEDKFNSLNDSYLRLHAEFDNFRKRTIKEKADLIKSGGERVLTEVLTFADDFERALQSLHSATDKSAVVEGMDLIYSKFQDFLGQHGVKEIEAIGQPFDADKFEAVTTIPAMEESQKGSVIDCIQKGYYLNDKSIRFPKVIVGE